MKLSPIQRAARWLVSKAAIGPTDVIGLNDGTWRPLVGEPFAGAWQRNITLDQTGITAFSAVYACITLRARDIGKLRVKLMEQQKGIWTEVSTGSPWLPVLRKPNRYQTRIQFLEYWMMSKLSSGNAYILKDRDARGIVTDLYPLHPQRVTPKIATDGSVWYDVASDYLSGVPQSSLPVPASEIIHDRCVPLFHPLLGVSPLFAACASATQGTKIQENSQAFFDNMSAPSGHLSAPGPISDPVAERMKRDYEAAKGGRNLGRLLVTGDGMKYEAFSMPAVEAQLIEQLRWTVEDVARCFGVPLHKIMAGSLPQVGNMAALDLAYYQQTLQEDIESIELLLDEGLGLVDVPGKTYGTELDLEGLLRMDPLTRADRLDKMRNTMTPNEARASENLPAVTGGDDVYRQQQDFSLSALKKRDSLPNPFVIDRPAANPTPSAAGPAVTADPSKPTKSAMVIDLRERVKVERAAKRERKTA